MKYILIKRNSKGASLDDIRKTLKLIRAFVKIIQISIFKPLIASIIVKNMTEEDEIDVLGDFSLDNLLSKNDSAMYVLNLL